MRNESETPVAGLNNVEIMALKIATGSPELKDLNSRQLENIARIVITQRLSEELKLKADIAGTDYAMEKEIFLLQSGHSGSEYTNMAYRKGLGLLEKYCSRHNLNILLLNYAQADDFIYSLKGAANSKRLTIAAVSAFYSYMERRNSSIRNPIRGTKARPVSRTVREIEIPDDEDMAMILDFLPEQERLAVYIMAYRGLRVGALNKLKIWGTHYQSSSKGKDISGEFPFGILASIRKSEYFNKLPFSNLSTNAIKLRVYRQTQKLHKEGKIKASYSAHDFRHYYAVTEYGKDKDIYKLSRLLDHTNIATTQAYLRSLKVEI
jgi:site-specific recombinase XerD